MSTDNEATEKVEEVKAEAAETEAKAEDKTKDVVDQVKEGALEAANALGGLLKKGGEALINATEKATHKDLNKDGKIGGE